MANKISLDRLDFDAASGTVLVRLLKDPVPAEGQYHRFSIAPGQDVDATLTTVNTSLVDDWGYPAMADGAMDAIRAFVTAMAPTP